jgi:hypothetical protein
MKHKVSELEGALLDLAVAMAEGKRFRLGQSGIEIFEMDEEHGDGSGWFPFRPQEWAYGGPIIEREQIVLMPGPHPDPTTGLVWWRAAVLGGMQPMNGHTHLVAAMRAYVASKFGEEVELP